MADAEGDWTNYRGRSRRHVVREFMQCRLFRARMHGVPPKLSLHLPAKLRPMPFGLP